MIDHISNTYCKPSLSQIFFYILLVFCSKNLAAEPANYIDYDIPPQSLGTALKSFAVQSQLQLLVSHDNIADVQSVGLSGLHKKTEALELLLKDTKLEYEISDDSVVVVQPRSSDISNEDTPVKVNSNSFDKSKSYQVAQNDIDYRNTKQNNAKQQAPSNIDNTSHALEEVIVTALKRELSLQDTPISVVAFSEQDLSQRGIANISDLPGYIPNLTYTTAFAGGSSAPGFYIRGIGEADFIVTQSPTVALYMDGVFISRSLGSALDIVDIERVEVLRGPQGTLFGRNTTGGAIHVITAKPSEEFKATAEITTGSRDRLDVKASADIPLIEDTLLSKFSIATFNQDGYGRRLLDGSETGDTENMAFRGQLHWIASDTVDFLVTGDTSRRRASAGTETFLGLDPTPGFIRTVVNPFFLAPQGLPVIDDKFVTNDNFTSFANEVSKDEYDIWGLSVSGTWQASDNLTVKSITSYRDLETDTGFDIDATPYPVIEQEIFVDHWQFTQELQLTGRSFNDKLEWIVGGFYFKEKGDELDRINVLSFVVPVGLGRVEEGFNEYLNVTPPTLQVNDIETESYAFYGQGTYALNEKINLTAGLRYTYESKDLTSSQSGFVFRARGTVGETWDNLSPKFGIEYHASDTLMTYASISRGFKSG
ncbi:MAG: TonB-dependent receptor, partial [Gammaproteobacteria bacterium]|nr:TonB-dependent receptor [Gammaproteobacteria bacterium]